MPCSTLAAMTATWSLCDRWNLLRRGSLCFISYKVGDGLPSIHMPVVVVVFLQSPARFGVACVILVTGDGRERALNECEWRDRKRERDPATGAAVFEMAQAVVGLLYSEMRSAGQLDGA